MRRLRPDPVVSVDIGHEYASADRPRPPDRPWITMLMIGSADGAAVVDGRSGALGGPADLAAYRAVRSLGDGVLVGAATARTERYRPLDAPRRLYLVTTTGDLGASADLLSAPTTTLVMPADGPAPAGVDVVRAGAGRVDLAGALGRLGHVDHLVCEGGPGINGQLLAAGLVDEVCLSLAPRFVAGDSVRIAHGAVTAAIEPWTLATVVADDDFLFLRYVRPR